MNWTPKKLAIAAGLVLVGGWYVKKKAGETIEQAAQAINPVNRENVFNSGFNGLYQSATGSEGSLGTDIADWLHDDSADDIDPIPRPDRQGF